jgi:hypothetical protein
LGVGLTANSIFVNWFDFVLYPGVMGRFGTLRGATIMWVLSFLVCYVTILFYDWAKQDWLGIETLKELRDEEASWSLRKVLSWATKKGDWLVLVVVSIWKDPFICTAYMRRGAHQYGGLTKRDWRIFLISLVIGNLWWTTAVFTGLELGELVLFKVCKWLTLPDVSSQDVLLFTGMCLVVIAIWHILAHRNKV